MTRVLALTDELIRRALTPDDSVQAPADLLEAIVSGIRSESAGPVTQRRGQPVFFPRRLTLTLIAAAAVLAVVAGLLLATGGRQQRSPVEEVTFEAFGLQLLGVGAEEVWVASHDGRLWHRTADGWTDPETIGLASIRDIARLPDGRLVITRDDWVSVVRESNGQLSPLGHGDAAGVALSGGVATDANGTVWIAERVGNQWGLAAYRPEEGGWKRSWVDCPAGGSFVEVAGDGSVWTGGFGYVITAGLARWDGSVCAEVFPLADAVTHDIAALAAGPGSEVAILIDEVHANEVRSPGLTMAWDGTTWSTLRSTQAPMIISSLAFGPRGELYAPDIGIWRYRQGAWDQVVDDPPVWEFSVAADGTLWYAVNLPDSKVVRHVMPGT